MAMLLASSVNAYHGPVEAFGIGSWDMSLINYYVCPGIMAGLAVFFFIILIFLFATC